MIPNQMLVILGVEFRALKFANPLVRKSMILGRKVSDRALDFATSLK